MKEKLNPFKIAQQQFDATAERLGLDEATRELLRRPMLEMHATLPVKMDDGSPVFDSPAHNATAHYLHNMLYLLGDTTTESAFPAAGWPVRAFHRKSVFRWQVMPQAMRSCAWQSAASRARAGPPASAGSAPSR